MRGTAKRTGLDRDVPRGLETSEIMLVAPTFYACSTSFTKYLVGRVGLPAVIAWMPLLSTKPDAAVVHTKAVERGIEQVTGTSMDVLRAGWRASIEAP